MAVVVDVTGKRYGAWIVLGRSDKVEKGRGVFWRCRCDCGAEGVVVGGNLRQGISTNCGCLRQPRVAELSVGSRYHAWTVLARGPKGRSGGSAMWKCQCDCGTVKMVRSASLRGQSSRSCGCTRTYDHNSFPDGDDRAYNGRFNVYKEGAHRRGHTFELNLAEFIAIAKQPCSYCGAPPSLKVRIQRIRQPTPLMSGVDRIDSSQGYFVGNCVPCCRWCNEMKLNRTAEGFLAHIAKIASWQARGQ